jgi:hypothetical protein
MADNTPADKDDELPITRGAGASPRRRGPIAAPQGLAA